MARSSPTLDSPHPDQRTAKGTRTRTARVLNVPLLVGTLIAAVAFCPAAYVWRSYQVGRTADAFLERVDTLEEEGEWSLAAAYLHRYLQLYPDETEVRVRLAETFDRGAEDPRRKSRAVDLYYHALGVAPAEKQPALRTRLAELLLELHRFAQAEQEATRVLAGDEDNPKAHRLLALSLCGQLQSGAIAARHAGNVPVCDALEAALALNPDAIELAATLACVHRSSPEYLTEDKRSLPDAQRARLADEIIERMVAANPTNAEAFVARYQYRARYGLPQTEEDLQAALKHGADNVEVLLLVADQAWRRAVSARRSGQPANDVSRLFEEARQHYQRVIELDPAVERGYLYLGEVAWLQGDADRALGVWRQGLEQTENDNIQLRLRLADALVVLQKLDEAEQELAALDSATMAVGPRLTRPARLAVERTKGLVRAKWFATKGEYRKAVPLLKRVAAGQQGTSPEASQVFQARLLLGSCHAALNEWSQAAIAYQQAAGQNPALLQPRLASAAAWSNADRPEKAIIQYEKSLALQDDPETRLALARTRYRRQMKLSNEARDWGAFDRELSAIKTLIRSQPLKNAWRVKLLEADRIVVFGAERGQVERACFEARERLRDAEEEFPDAPQLLRILVNAYDRIGYPADADRVLTKLNASAGQTVEACLLRAGLHTRRKEFEKARRVLRTAVQNLPPKTHVQLQYGLARVSLAEGDTEQAYQELARLHEAAPANARLVQQLTELSFELRDLEAAQRWEGKLRELEGPDGSVWSYYRARRFLAQTADVQHPRFAEAETLHAQLQTRRPDWPMVHVLGAQILERRGQLDQAIESYQQAIQMGEQRVLVYQRLIALLYRQQRFAEAETYLTQLQDRVPVSPGLSSLEISVAARRGQPDRAVAAARRGVERRPDDPMARIWLGQTLLVNGELEEAEKTLHKAVQLAPKDVRTYNGLFTLYIRAGELEKARQTLQELGQTADISESQRAFVLAQGYETIGDRQQAQTHYHEAERLAPESAAIPMRLAAFLLRSDPEEAERALRRSLKLAPESGVARRMLAAILASRGGEREWQEAQQLLEQSGGNKGGAVLDQRLQAVLLARRGSANDLERAKQILERLVADAGELVAGDQLLLARLYESEGKLLAAQEQYVELVSRAEPNVSHLVLYIDMLLRHEWWEDATSWLKKLEELTPNSLRTMSLRARWLHAQNRGSDVESFVEPLGQKLMAQIEKDEKRQTQLCLALGNLYASVDQHQAAERWYRRLDKLMPGKAYAPLAMSLARQNKMPEGIRICVDAADSGNLLQAAIVLGSVLTAGAASEGDFVRAEPVFANARKEHSDNVDLLLSIAGVRVVQQRGKDAVALYRRVLELEPTHLLALNNLATLLAEQPEQKGEALDIVDRAIKIAGPQAGLLDTKGMILVHAKKPDQALPWLKTAAASPAADPRYHFHLAVAYHQLGKAEKARDALKKAREGNLEGQILTLVDRKWLAELNRDLPR